jgi:hypothetical protein
MWRSETYSKMILNTVNVIFFNHMLMRPEIEMKLRTENFRTLSRPALFQASSSILSADKFHNRWNGWRGPNSLTFTQISLCWAFLHWYAWKILPTPRKVVWRLWQSRRRCTNSLCEVPAGPLGWRQSSSDADGSCWLWDPSHVPNSVATCRFNSKRWYLLSGHLRTDLTVWSLKVM